MSTVVTLSDGVTLLVPTGINVSVTTDQPGPGPGPGPNPDPGPTPVPPGAIDFSNQTGQKQYPIPAGDFHFVAYNLKPGTGPGDHLGWVKLAPQIGGDQIGGNLSITDCDQNLNTSGNIAVSWYFTVGGSSPSYPGAPMFPAGGTCNIIGHCDIPIIVDIRMVNY